MSVLPLPFSDACERNKEPILGVLRTAFSRRSRVLEIGSGTGQHAVFFGASLPDLAWQPTERAQNMEGLAARIAAEGTPNVRSPLTLDVNQPEWPLVAVDAAFTANTLHIMSWPEVVALFTGLGRHLMPEATLAIYGPFLYHGQYTSPSNRLFDQSLKARDTQSGIRDIAAVTSLAENVGFQLDADHDLPAHNRLLVFNSAARR